jgi:membrane protease YdiL (CAAX protease family)
MAKQQHRCEGLWRLKKEKKNKKAPVHRLPTEFSQVEFGLVSFCAYGLYLAAAIFGWRTRGAAASNEIAVTNAELLELVIAQLVVATLLGGYLAARGWRVRHFRMGFSIVSAFKGVVLLIASLIVVSSIHALAYAVPAVSQTVAQTSFTMQLSLWAVLVTAVVNPFFEEMLHLGYVQQRLASHGPLFAIGASTLLRALMHVHQGALALLDVVPIGILYGCVYWYGRRLLPIIVAHGLMDFMALAGMIR